MCIRDRGAASVCMMAQVAGADLFPVDIGIASDVPGLTRAEYKIARGTGNMVQGLSLIHILWGKLFL